MVWFPYSGSLSETKDSDGAGDKISQSLAELSPADGHVPALDATDGDRGTLSASETGTLGRNTTGFLEYTPIGGL